jgi:hypothetical protein
MPKATLTKYGLALIAKRIIADPDVDYVGTQDQTGAAYEIPAPGGASKQLPVRVECIVIWKDGAKANVLGAGSFQLRALKAKAAPADGVGGGASTVVVGSVESEQAGYQPVEIPDCRTGDKVGIQLSGINAPVGAVEAWIYLDISLQVAAV